MRAPRLATALLCLLAGGALLTACGSDSETVAYEPAESRPAPPESAFPGAEGRTLREVLKAADDPSESIVVDPQAEVFYPGVNRYPFGVADRERGPVSDAEVALYIAKVPAPKRGSKSKSGNRGQLSKAQSQALDQPARGPFPARIETLATKPAFRGRTTTEDPDAAKVVYSVDLDLPGEGEWRVAAILKEGEKTKGMLLPGAVVVGEFEKIPRPGDEAPLIHTPTADSAGGDLSRISTRVPPDSQNKVDYAEALGREPIVLLFATPEFCQSRVCGPVVDVAEQAQAEYGDEAAFIHMEIYNDNDPAEGVRPQVRKFHLPTEPFLFTIDRDGTVADVIEGAFGLDLMHRAVDKAIAE
ncbi:MAG TPA: hypothetical protein VFU16_03825 [Solirubrobacterales bacterium]|nr:hypothetical protein [Solirubrobacterales bacterium]